MRALRGDRGSRQGRRRARASSSAGSSPATASASPPACPRAGRAPRACCRSPKSEAHDGVDPRLRRLVAEGVQALAQLARAQLPLALGQRQLGDDLPRAPAGRGGGARRRARGRRSASVPPRATAPAAARRICSRGSSTSECRKLAVTRSKLPAGCETARSWRSQATVTPASAACRGGDVERGLPRCRSRSPSSPARPARSRRRPGRSRGRARSPAATPVDLLDQRRVRLAAPAGLRPPA